MVPGDEDPVRMRLRVEPREEPIDLADRSAPAYVPGMRRPRCCAAIAVPVIAAPFRCALPDPDDRAFVEVALGGAAGALLTGNVRHFPIGRMRLGFDVLTPRQLIERLRHDDQ